MIDAKELLEKPEIITVASEKEIKEILEKAEKKLGKMPKLVEVGRYRKVVFVGDIHGDFDAVKQVFRKYFDIDTCLVFLGDYVDRGSQSEECINYLLAMFCEFDNVILLMGNHEACPVIACWPNDFWMRARERKLEKDYAKTLTKLPLAVSVGDILALHGGLPNVERLSEIENIKISEEDDRFHAIIWDDFEDAKGMSLGVDAGTGRRKFGKDYFKIIMEKLGKKVLVRAHQPDVKGTIFDDKCLTLLTSASYSGRGNVKGRILAIADIRKKIESVKDLRIEEI